MINRFLKMSMIVACFSFATAFADELVVNGSFETGDFTGWEINSLANSSGSFFPSSLSVSPLNSNPIGSPPDGKWAAVSDQVQGVGSDILFQDITIPSNISSAILKFTYYYYFPSQGFLTPGVDFPGTNNLDFNNPSSNAQFRVDIMKPSAPQFSIAAGDVLMNLLQSISSDPVPSSVPQYNTLTFDLTSFAGQTIRLRFAVVTNITSLNFAVDAVSITTPTSASILPPSNLKTCVKKNRFLSQIDVFTTLNWSASPSASVAGYNIYRNGTLIAECLYYQDHCGSCNTYQVSAFDSEGHESQRI